MGELTQTYSETLYVVASTHRSKVDGALKQYLLASIVSENSETHEVF